MSSSPKLELTFTFAVTAMISVIYMISRNLLQSVIASSYSNSSVIKFASAIGLISTAIVPFIYVSFLLLSTYVMVLLFNGKGKINILLSKMGYCMLPILFSSLFSYYILLDLENSGASVSNPDQLKAIKMTFSLTLENLNVIANMSYVGVYIILILVLKKYFRLSILSSLLSAAVPSVIFILMRLIL
jgi:hypothetical protein